MSVAGESTFGFEESPLPKRGLGEFVGGVTFGLVLLPGVLPKRGLLPLDDEAGGFDEGGFDELDGFEDREAGGFEEVDLDVLGRELEEGFPASVSSAAMPHERHATSRIVKNFFNSVSFLSDIPS